MEKVFVAVGNDVLTELVRVIIISQLDYCNSLSYALLAVLYQRLQRLIAPARRVTIDSHQEHQLQDSSSSYSGCCAELCALLSSIILPIYYPDQVTKYLGFFCLSKIKTQYSSIYTSFKFLSLV